MPDNISTTARPGPATFVTTISPADVNNNHTTMASLQVPGEPPAPTTHVTTTAVPSPGLTNRPGSADPWADLIKPQIFIVKNPMHVINFNKNRSKSKLVRSFQFLKSFTEKWFSHFLLLGVLFLYGCFGAWMFILIEGGVRHEIERPVINMKERIKSDILYFALHRQYSRDFVAQLIDKRLYEFELQIQENCKSGYDGENPLKTWSFWNALFFCVTVFTTIGYGHICPETPYGQVFCIVYAFFGIPLVLIVLTDLGKLFTRMIKTAMRATTNLFRHKRLQTVRQMGRRATMAPVQFWSETKRRLSSVATEQPTEIKPSQNAISNNEMQRTEISFSPDGAGGFTSVNGIGPSLTTDNLGKYHTIGTPPPIIISQSPFGPLTSTDTFNHFGPGAGSGTTQYSAEAVPYQVDEEFNLPVTLAMFILTVYFLLGSVLFFNTEKWTLLESFYFVYISLTTVGFGDYVPESPILMIAASVYIMFGLALTSMCINVIQEKLSQSLERAKERLGARIGLGIGMDDDEVMAASIPAQTAAPAAINVKAPSSKNSSATNSRKSSTAGQEFKPKLVLQEENVGAKLKQRREQKKLEIETNQNEV